MNRQKKQHLLNNEIKASEVRVEGVIMSLFDAIKQAENENLDLVLLAPTAQPPVCKIMSYEKFIYELNKKDKNKSLDMKEVKVGPNTSENDLSYRIKNITEFLQKGHKVRISMQFKGREMAHTKNGEELVLKMIVAIEEYGVPEAFPKLEGKRMFVTLKPKTKK